MDGRSFTWAKRPSVHDDYSTSAQENGTNETNGINGKDGKDGARFVLI